VVVTFAVRGNTISGWVVGRHRLPVFEGLRVPSTGSRWDIRRLSGGGKSSFFCF
jgi:hypothetical protein